MRSLYSPCLIVWFCVAWFIMVVLQWRTGLYPPALGRAPWPCVAPPRGTNQTHLRTDLATDCEIQVKPGQVLSCLTLSLMAVAVALWCDVGAFRSHCCLSIFQIDPCRDKRLSWDWSRYQGSGVSGDWPRGHSCWPLVTLIVSKRIKDHECVANLNVTHVQEVLLNLFDQSECTVDRPCSINALFYLKLLLFNKCFILFKIADCVFLEWSISYLTFMKL